MAKAMGKFTHSADMRKELAEKFQKERGAKAAFCREKGITMEWLRLVLVGEYDSIDLLIEAADFLTRYKSKKHANRMEKEQHLADLVAAIS